MAVRLVEAWRMSNEANLIPAQRASRGRAGRPVRAGVAARLRLRGMSSAMAIDDSPRRRIHGVVQDHRE